MTVQGTEHGVDAGLSEPIACSLTNADLKAQRDRWINLSTEFGLNREKTPDGLRLAFVDRPAVERELRALVAVENGCCSWAAWSVERADGMLVMAARSKGAGIAALRAMFANAMSATSGCGDC
jgi:hypothetical protein